MDKKTLILYTTADGKTIEVEVTEAIAKLLADFQREDESYWRKMRRHNELSLDALSEDTEFEPIDPTADVEANYIEQEGKVELTAAINKLSKKDRELIETVYFEEVSAKDYAEKNGISFQAVYKRLVKIYEKLKNILSETVE